MKYYINGVKVRTSNHFYSHAVCYNGKVIACCGNEYLALKKLHSELHYREDQMRQYNDNHEYQELLFKRIQTLCIKELEMRA